MELILGVPDMESSFSGALELQLRGGVMREYVDAGVLWGQEDRFISKWGMHVQLQDGE
jgi:hypothetical protein